MCPNALLSSKDKRINYRRNSYEYCFWINFAMVCNWMFDVPS